MGKAVVQGKSIFLSKGEEAEIPVEIDNNNGIMGFKIMLDYDSSKIDIVSLTAGGITSNGNFISNVGDKKGHIDVVWSHYENVSGAGTIFKLSVKMLENIKNPTEIKISYSENDTFNSEWEDVALDCKNIKISGGIGSEKDNETSVVSSEKKENNQSELSDNQIIDVIQEVMYELGYNSIDEVNDTDDFVSKVNKSIQDKTGVKNYYKKDMDGIKSDYTNIILKKYKESILDNVSPPDIQLAITDSLNNQGAKVFDEINDVEKFISDVQENLSEYYPNAKNISDEIETDEEIKLIKELYSKVKDVQIDNFSLYLILVPILLGVTIIVIMLIVIKKKGIYSKNN